jgi:antitoxin VapB
MSPTVATAKVFTAGNNQAVRLPKAFRVDAREMWISRNEQTGEITLRPKPDADALQAFLDELRSLPASDEFVPQRDDAAQGDPLLVSHNTRHFEQVASLRLEDWMSEPPG